MFDTAKIEAREGSPLIIANVHYATAQERIDHLNKYVAQFAGILRTSNLPEDKFSHASFYFFERLTLFAAFTKHVGFKEENEWRIVYLKRRDTDNVFSKMFSYHVGPRGVEPKLKLKVEEIPGLPETHVTLPHIVDQIILGPSLSGPLARSTIVRMIETLNLADLKDRIHSSMIPFRAM